MLDRFIEIALSYIVPLCEIMGIIVVVITTLTSFLMYLKSLVNRTVDHNIKFRLASGLALSLEFKMAAEILKTVLVRELTELVVLGAVIFLRALLSLLIHFEMKRDGERQNLDE